MGFGREQRHGTARSAFESPPAWRGGAVGGFVATVVMGLAISVMNLETLRVSIAALYGFEGSLLVGWVAHLLHGTLFGLVFAAVLSDPTLVGIRAWVWKSAVAGVVYGLVLAVVGAGIIMPIWLGVAGVASPPSMPYVTVPTLVWHAIYGTVLGAVFPFAAGR